MTTKYLFIGIMDSYYAMKLWNAVTGNDFYTSHRGYDEAEGFLFVGPDAPMGAGIECENLIRTGETFEDIKHMFMQKVTNILPNYAAAIRPEVDIYYGETTD